MNQQDVRHVLLEHIKQVKQHVQTVEMDITVLEELQEQHVQQELMETEQRQLQHKQEHVQHVKTDTIVQVELLERLVVLER